MAHLAHNPPAPVAERFDSRHAGSLPTLMLGAGVIGVIGSLIGLAVPAWREQFAFSWLFASFFFFSLCLGGLFWTIVHHATDAEWSTLVRRQMENLAGVIPLFIIFFGILVLCCKHYLWRWWEIQPGTDAVLDAKAGYLNHTFFIIRFFAYFLILGGLAFVLRGHSVSQDRDGNLNRSNKMRKWSAGGLIGFGVCITFAAVDWLMGIDYHWASTMWGVYVFAGSAGAGMSLVVIIVTSLRDKGYLKPVTLEHYHIMGKWMLAFTIFWAYIGFAQYMLIWYANIPEENIYFRVRNTEGWFYLSSLLVIGRFFLPFPILLTQWIKKHPHRLCYVAWWIIFMQLVDMYVIVLPGMQFDHPGVTVGLHFHILDLLALLGVGGLAGTVWFWLLRNSNLFPNRDPRLAGSVKLTN